MRAPLLLLIILLSGCATPEWAKTDTWKTKQGWHDESRKRDPNAWPDRPQDDTKWQPKH